MNRLTIILIFGFLSCGHADHQNNKIIQKNKIPENAIAITTTVGIKVQGDFDGNGQPESAVATKTKEGQGNPIEDGTADNYSINFSTTRLKPINVGCCDIRLINEGDLNDDGRDDISVFQAPMNGCTYSMTTYSLQNGKWKQIFEPFLVPTACDTLSDDYLQNMIFKENGINYFYETDINSEPFKLVKKKLALK